MTLGGFLLLVVIVALVGLVGQAIAGYSLGGCLASALVGFIGAWIGQWIAGTFELPWLLPVTVQGQTVPVVWATVGSAVLTILLSFFLRRRTVYVR